MSGATLADRLCGIADLSSSERQALDRLEGPERTARRGASVCRDHHRGGELVIIRGGWMMSCVLLDDGSRQILRVYLPGDVVMGSMAMTCATESLVALTDVRFAQVETASLKSLFEDHPRLAALLFLLAQAERASLTDRLASLGRTSAKSRVAAMLLDIADRQRTLNPAISACFPFPLTQEEVGDATGLTAVHVNRMMRVLVDEQLISRSNAHITLIDEKRLAKIGCYVNRQGALQTAWLPDPR